MPHLPIRVISDPLIWILNRISTMLPRVLLIVLGFLCIVATGLENLESERPILETRTPAEEKEPVVTEDKPQVEQPEEENVVEDPVVPEEKPVEDQAKPDEKPEEIVEEPAKPEDDPAKPDEKPEKVVEEPEDDLAKPDEDPVVPTENVVEDPTQPPVVPEDKPEKVKVPENVVEGPVVPESKTEIVIKPIVVKPPVELVAIDKDSKDDSKEEKAAEKARKEAERAAELISWHERQAKQKAENEARQTKQKAEYEAQQAKQKAENEAAALEYWNHQQSLLKAQREREEAAEQDRLKAEEEEKRRQEVISRIVPIEPRFEPIQDPNLEIVPNTETQPGNDDDIPEIEMTPSPETPPSPSTISSTLDDLDTKNRMDQEEGKQVATSSSSFIGIAAAAAVAGALAAVAIFAVLWKRRKDVSEERLTYHERAKAALGIFDGDVVRFTNQSSAYPESRASTLSFSSCVSYPLPIVQEEKYVVEFNGSQAASSIFTDIESDDKVDLAICCRSQ